MLYFTVYKTINIINGKFYIGKHITKVVNDSYLGSGKRLRLAIEKYGKKNFKKEILAVFYNEDLMNKKEAELVTEALCVDENSYNLCVGGRGGWSYVNRLGLGLRTGCKISQSQIDAMRNGRGPVSEETREKIRQNSIRTSESRSEKIRQANLGKPKPKSTETRLKISNSLKGRHLTESTKQKIADGNRGKIVSDETKAKLSLIVKAYHKRNRDNKLNLCSSESPLS